MDGWVGGWMGWMCISLASDRLEGFYSYSAFKILSIIVRFLVNMNIPAPKTGTLLLSPHCQNAGFLENCTNDLV
jgi:hypothetical protein